MATATSTITAATARCCSATTIPRSPRRCRRRSRRGTHFGASHPLEVRWAEAIRRLMPSAERVRFTSSGTEATLMAVRLARAFTGKRKIVRFKTHFHGWHDHMTSGYAAHFDGSPTPGVLAEVAANVVLLEPNDVDALRAAAGRATGRSPRR